MREMKDSGIEWIGEIPRNKRIIRNKYLLVYTKGKLPIDTNFEGIGFPYIGATDLDSNEPCKTYTSDKTLPDSCDSDLLVLWDGARAGLCGTHKVGKVSSTIVRIREVDSTIYRPFLYWYYKGFEDYMYQRVNGTTIPHMNRRYIEEIQMIDWTVQEQRRIADYLDRKCSQIDAIIARQQEVIEKLKDYKLSIITEAVTKGLNPDVPMKDSGVEWIGEIPDFWNVVPLKTCSDILPGYAFSSNDFDTENGTALLRGINVTPNGVRWEDVVYWNKPITEQLRAFELVAGDIVVGLDRPWVSGGTRVCWVTQKDLPALLLQRVCRIRAKENIDSRWIYHWIASKSFQEALSIETTGVSVPHISTKQIGQFSITLPPIEVQHQICDTLETKCYSIDKIADKKQAIIDKLTEYKKSLIYEDVTGKKEV